MLIDGTIVRLVALQGFGFVGRPDNATEYFFHRSAVAGGRFDTLEPGQAIRFTIDPLSERGPRASRVEVTVVDPSGPEQSLA